MLFTETNLKNLDLTIRGNFRDIVLKKTYYYHYACEECGYPYLHQRKNSKYCSHVCRCKSMIFRTNVSNGTKGKLKSDIHRQNISMSKIGKKVSIETKKKMSDAHRGEKHHFYGKHHTKESKQKMSIARKGRFCGKDHPGWIHGQSLSPYCPLWRDREYKNWLKYERDGGKCQNQQCDCISNKLVLHHINYDKKDCRPINLITLCNSCNCKANKDREWHTAYYTEIIRRLKTDCSFTNKI